MMALIRSAGARDAQRISELVQRAFVADFGEAWNTPQIATALQHPTTFAEIAEDGGSVVGFTLGRIAGDEAELLLVGVDPSKRGRGLGRRLVESICATLAHRGATTLFLEVRDGNAEAVQLYKSAGFTKIGIRPAYYTGPNQQRFDAVTMRRSLAQSSPITTADK